MSPVLPKASTLAGQWEVMVQGSAARCTLNLTLRPIRNGHVVEHDGRCIRSLRLGEVALWRPATDGIALASASGGTLAFFAREKGGYVLRKPRCATLHLTRRTSWKPQ